MMRRSWLSRTAKAVELSALATEPLHRIGRFVIFQEASVHPSVLRVEMSAKKEFGGSSVNLMDDAFFDELRATFDWVSVEAPGDVRACVLHGPRGAADGSKKGCFSAGLNLTSVAPKLLKDVPMSQMAKLSVRTAVGSNPGSLTEPGMPAMRAMHLRKLIKRYQDAVTSIPECRLPVIASIDGHCIGGAVDVASACDIRFASATAQMSIKETAIGIVADLGTLQRTARIVGEGTLREWAFTGRTVHAEEALHRQYYNKVLPDGDQCLAHSLSVAAEIAEKASPLAVQGTKAVLNHASEKAVAAELEHVRLWNTAFLKSDDLLEAAAAFAKKRPVTFDGASRVVDERSTSSPSSQGGSA